MRGQFRIRHPPKTPPVATGKFSTGFADDPAHHDGIKSILIRAIRKQVLTQTAVLFGIA
jgi:hypothetical protein